MVQIAIGMDVGGSGIKAALVDVRTGKLVSERRRVETPASKQPAAVLGAVEGLVASFEPKRARLGVGFPAVVVDGRPRTGFTAHQVASWIGFPLERHLARRTGRRVTLLNDADAAGLAETRFGTGRGKRGVVLVLTLGTGIGSALFVDGRLVPNLELGSLYLRRRLRVAEYSVSAEAREREGLGWSEYAARLDQYLHHVERLFTPDLVVVGGGISRKAAKFLPLLTVRTRVVPAAFRNNAGIVGAALAAAES